MQGSSEVVSNLFFGNGESTLDTSANIMGEDPLLGADHVPSSGSPAIDAGQTSFSWGETSVSVSDGFMLGSAPDLGAKEAQ